MQRQYVLLGFVFTATGLLGICVAIKIARASAGSFLLPMLKALTNFAGISG
jgi:hypothetical protein